MNASRISPLPIRLLTIVTALALLAVPALTLRAQDAYNDLQAAPQGDPPSRVARISVLQGNVSFQPATVNDFSAAELNYPLTSGDRLYTDNGAFSEVEIGNLVARLGPQADFTLTTLTDQVAQFGLAQGSVILKTYALDPDTNTEIDTPNAAITVLASGVVRVDYFPEDNITVVRELSGQVHVDADGIHQVLEGTAQVLRITGSNPSTWDSEDLPQADELDRFSGQRDSFDRQAEASEGSYVPPDMIGAEDLAANGDWENTGDYGPVWYPNDVAVDWAPYSNGRWVSIAPWGWTWVGGERWGFAPYHYGRWFRVGNRWGWAPGPPTAHPMYSPALVAFVGGAGFAVGGAGVTAWFPLGPGEAYHPWYRTSAAYVNRVNAGGFRGNHASPTAGGYMNRAMATTAVPVRNFGNGRPVRESRVHVDAGQLQSAPVTGRPPVAPQRQAVVGAPARAIPTLTARPVLPTRSTETRNASPGNGQPAEITRPGYARGQQNAAPAQATHTVPTRDKMQPSEAPAQERNMQERQPEQPVQPARNMDRPQRTQLPETVLAPTSEPTPAERPAQPRPEPQRPDFQRVEPQRTRPQTEPQRTEPQRPQPPQRTEAPRTETRPVEPQRQPQPQPQPQRQYGPPPQPRPQQAQPRPQPQPAHTDDKKK